MIATPDKKESPLKCLGWSGKMAVMGGAYEMLDRLKMPLAQCMQEAQKRGMVISLVHFFACAIQDGKPEGWAFDRIREALELTGQGDRYLKLVKRCNTMLQRAGESLPYEARARMWEIGREMRFVVEMDGFYASKPK